MISPTMQQATNDQVREELYSFYLYLSMSNHLDSLQLKGMASWMRAQANEELSHALKLIDHLQERGGTVKLQALAQPQAEWASPLAAFQAALQHERHITARINELYGKALDEKDHASTAFLQWFVKEQVEEEATLEPIVYRMEQIGDSKGALFYLDHQLGKRSE